MTHRAGRGITTFPEIGIDVRPKRQADTDLYLWLQDVCSHANVGRRDKRSKLV